ncbi:MAG: hypothetical protein GY795_02655 [Desulfobacterales bacterium]|nr:hypothetical protein [Desulfobacterales bacterium]
MKKPLTDVHGLFIRKICFVILFLVFNFNISYVLAEDHEASIPWSGYWWPLRSGELVTGYKGHPAPLEKYDLLTTGMERGPLTSWFSERYYDPSAPDWYGFCAELAWAACYEQYEIFPSSEDNIIFRVGDKKGLLTLAHTRDIIEAADGSLPEIFHYWLLRYIKDEARAFVADLSTGNEVWSYPIYRYSAESTVSNEKESVTVKIYYASNNVHADYMGTMEFSRMYTYDLFLDEHGNINRGEWTGESVNDHPEGLSIPVSVGELSYLDYELVSKLARAKDDFLEDRGKVVQINPGTYNLILMDEDSYRIDCLPGDTISLTLEKQPESSEDMIVSVTNSKDSQVGSAFASQDEPVKLVITAENPPYTVKITQNNYSDPNFYTLVFDLGKKFNQRIPYIPKTGIWSGFALTNPNETEAAGVMLVTGSKNGNPLQTVSGPFNIAPGEKKLFFFEDLSWRRHELPDTDNLNLLSDVPVSLLNVTESGTCFVQEKSRGSHLIIPDTVPPMTPGLSMFGEVANESFEEAVVLLRLYSGDGKLVKESSEFINPRSTLFITPGNYPFTSMPSSGWIEIIGDENRNLSGYQYIRNRNRTETLFAIPVLSSEKIVPHIPPPGDWITTVTLINPNDLENRVSFHLKLAGNDNTNDMNIILKPREKRALELQDQFGGRPGDPFYHSVLEIKGEYPVTGYYTYSTTDTGQDEASLPLLDENDFSEQLILPHYAGNDGYWWTGAGIFNPSSFSVSVRIEPYDNNGNLMDNIVKYMNLSSGAYEVFEIGAFFGGSGISFLKFRTQEGVIGGFYLYGGNSNKLLCGANMQSF